MRKIRILRGAGMPAVAALGLMTVTGAGAASLLSLGPRGVQALVSGQLFNRSGRWYLMDDGACYTYLEMPRTHLETDRLVLIAHLTSRLGQRIGNTCAGADFASSVTLSGRLRGREHSLVLDDLRIDRVDDEAARDALNLALKLVPDALPRSASIDVLELVRNQAVPNGALGAHLDHVNITDIVTRPAAVAITFDLSMSSP